MRRALGVLATIAGAGAMVAALVTDSTSAPATAEAQVAAPEYHELDPADFLARSQALFDQERSAGDIADTVTMQHIPDTVVFKVVAQDPDPGTATRLANEAADALATADSMDFGIVVVQYAGGSPSA